MIRLFCHLALDSARRLPAAERADVLDTAALLLAAEHPKESEAARAAAADLRNAEAAQMELYALLSAAIDTNKVH